MGAKTVTTEAYFFWYCRVCRKATLWVDIMGDDHCTTCIREANDVRP